MANATVVVVDDDAAVRTLVTRALTVEGYSVHSAPDGLEGLRVIDKVKPQVVILDVDMPQVDGYRLARAIKSKPETMSIPIIFVTGMAEPRAIVEGINSGARFYVTKPFEIAELLDKVRRALNPKS